MKHENDFYRLKSSEHKKHMESVDRLAAAMIVVVLLVSSLALALIWM